MTAHRNTGPLAFSYQRFSSPTQSEGDSLRRQTAFLNDWLKRSGAKLDTTIRGEGVSAHKGEHRRNHRHALARFLQLVQDGRIPQGSYLVVESLDRLSREDIQPATKLFLDILQAGIRIVQLTPREAVFDETSGLAEIFNAMMEFGRGHGESAIKSKRLGAVWSNKKQGAAPGVVISRACPAWIRVVGGRYQLYEAHAEVVRRIFRLATDGLGARAIVRRLIDDGVKPISGRRGWNTSYVRLILSTPAAYGVYQPMKGAGANRKPDGEPVAGFYPAAVTRDQFDAAQGTPKLKRAGRPSKSGVNVFAGLARDGVTGDALHMHTFQHGTKSYPSLNTRNGTGFSFPLKVLEEAVFSHLKEIDPQEVLPEDRTADNIRDLIGRRDAIMGKLARVKKSMAENPDVASLVDVMRDLERQEKAVADELAAARQDSASTIASAFLECRSLLDVLGDDAARVKLRTAMRRVLTGIWCVFVGGRKGKLAALQLKFAGEGKTRNFIIAYRPEVVGFGGRHPSRTASLNFDDAGVPAIDLSKPSNAAKVVKFLEKIDLNKALSEVQ